MRPRERVLDARRALLVDAVVGGVAAERATDPIGWAAETCVALEGAAAGLVGGA